jgi:transposase
MTNGKQRYKCRACGYYFTRSYGRGIKPESILVALQLYKHGFGYREIGRMLGVSNVAVRQWIRQVGPTLRTKVLCQLPQAADEIGFVSMDELPRYIEDKGAHYRYGLVCFVPQTLVPANASLPCKWAIVAPRRAGKKGRAGK